MVADDVIDHMTLRSFLKRYQGKIQSQYYIESYSSPGGKLGIPIERDIAELSISEQPKKILRHWKKTLEDTFWNVKKYPLKTQFI